MDFSFSPDQVELQRLARRILGDTCTPEYLKATAATDTGTDLALWRALGEAGLIGIGLDEAAGGGGYGWLETAIVLNEVGRHTAPVPALAVLVAAPSLAVQPDLLDGVAEGSVIVAPATHEAVGDVGSPTTTVDSGRLTGTKVCVPSGLLASRFVVTAADGLYAVDASAPGVTVTRQDTTSGVPDALVEFAGAPAARLGGQEASADLLRRAVSAVAVIVAGSCETALSMTAEYAKTRVQFERPIASFQAVSQRAGDAYIDTEAIRLTAWQAAWRLANDYPADNALLTAKFWAAEGGWRVVHAAHHIHGGFGVDRDYPLHRHFLMQKQLELLWGSATPSLRDLGRRLVS